MRILFLTQIIPYPPDAGPRVKTWNVLRYLARSGHQVILASFLRPEEAQQLPAIRQVCAEVHTVPIRRSRLADLGYWLRSHLTGRPFLIERDDLQGMRTLVEHLVATRQIDMIHADQLTMTLYALPFARKKSLNTKSGSQDISRRRPFTLFDAHNAVWTIVERMSANAPWFLKPVADLEARRVKKYEGEIVRMFDFTLAVTEPDRLALEEAVRFSADGEVDDLPAIRVVPIAVDTRQLVPVIRREGSKEIVTLGTLHYPPNADGIRWFARDVFPLVREIEPTATLTIIGKNPPADFFQLQAQQPGVIKVTGYVPDLGPYLEAAALMAVPVRAGGGMRVRILEALARGMPVVTTTIGLEGIAARHGEEVLVADSAEEFAREVARLLADNRLQARLAHQGRTLAESRYDWQVVLADMDEIYRSAGQEVYDQIA